LGWTESAPDFLLESELVVDAESLVPDADKEVGVATRDSRPVDPDPDAAPGVAPSTEPGIVAMGDLWALAAVDMESCDRLSWLPITPAVATRAAIAARPASARRREGRGRVRRGMWGTCRRSDIGASCCGWVAGRRLRRTSAPAGSRPPP
jgi:hypothetical protein